MHDDEMRRLLLAVRRLLTGRPGQLLLLLVLAVAASQEITRPDYSGNDSARYTGIVLVMLLVALGVARRWPSFAAGTATLATTIAIARTPGATLGVTSFCLVLLLLVQLVIRRGPLFAVTLLLPFVVYTTHRLDGRHDPLSSSAPLLFLVGALAIGEALRRRGLAVAALDATEEAMAESTRARTVMEERARIARELHDIVAHHLSVIAIESEAARLTSPGLPAEAGGRLEAIADTAREALTETRRLLGVLRADTASEADRAPQPGLGELDELIGRAQATGTHIRLARVGAISTLPRSVDLAAYRIVQEALTNARRHAPGADVDVELAYRADALHLHVRDYGPGARNGVALDGHGLMGMRERAALAGGTFSAGTAEGGGFEVLVTLPTLEAVR